MQKSCRLLHEERPYSLSFCLGLRIPDTRSLSSSITSFSHLLFNPPYKYSLLFPLKSRADKLQSSGKLLQYNKATYYSGHRWRIQELQTALRFGRPAPLLVWGQEQIIAEVFPVVPEELAKQRLLFFQSQFLPVRWYLCLQEAARRAKTVTNLDQRKKLLKHCAIKHKNSLRIGRKGDTQRKNKG